MFSCTIKPLLPATAAELAEADIKMRKLQSKGLVMPLWVGRRESQHIVNDLLNQ